MQIQLDLTENATRGQILDTLLGLMNKATRAKFDDIMAVAVVPDGHCHTVVEVNAVVDSLEVPERVRVDMRGVYAILAQAEATVHGCPVEQTHFHEVGNASGIRNALAICVAFAVLGAEDVKATPVQVGSGTVECAHGTLPIPAPATAAIVEGLPLCENRLPGERCTPTSAAIIRHFVSEFA